MDENNLKYKADDAITWLRKSNVWTADELSSELVPESKSRLATLDMMTAEGMSDAERNYYDFSKMKLEKLEELQLQEKILSDNGASAVTVDNVRAEVAKAEEEAAISKDTYKKGIRGQLTSPEIMGMIEEQAAKWGEEHTGKRHYSYLYFEPVMYDHTLNDAIEAFGHVLRIPVMPSNLTITQSADHNEEQSLMIGGVLERNAPSLRQFSVQSFVPRSYIVKGTKGQSENQDDWGGRSWYDRTPITWAAKDGERSADYADRFPFIQDNWINFIQFIMKHRLILDYYMFLAPIERHRQERFYVCIKNFEYTFNPHDDIDYKLDLIEWREPKIRLTEEITTDATLDKPQRKPSGGRKDGTVLLVLHDNIWQSTDWSYTMEWTKMFGFSDAKTTGTVDQNAQFIRKERRYQDKNVVGFQDVRSPRIIYTTVKVPVGVNVLHHTASTINIEVGFDPDAAARNIVPPDACGFRKIDVEGKGKVLVMQANSKMANVKPLEFSFKFDVAEILKPHPIRVSHLAKDTLEYKKEVVRLQRRLENKLTSLVQKELNQRMPKWMSQFKDVPPMLNFYDGADLVGVDGSAMTDYNDYGQHDPQMIRRQGYNAGSLGSWVAYSNTSRDQATSADAPYSLNAPTQSRVHNKVTSSCGIIPYDDLVQRVEKRNVVYGHIRGYIHVTGLKMRVTRVVDNDAVEATGTVNVHVGYVTDGSDVPIAKITTVGTRYYKNQTFCVYDPPALRPPTQTEVAFDRQRGRTNIAMGRTE